MLMLLRVWILNRIVILLHGLIAQSLKSPPKTASSANMLEWHRPQALRLLEFLHEVHERVDAFDGHGVVDGRAHAAHRAMPFEIHEADLGRLGAEGLVEIGLGERERHVHPGARVLRHRALVEARCFDEAVELLGLGAIALLPWPSGRPAS